MTKSFIGGIIDSVFSNSSIFDRFRDMVHDSYKNEKAAISKELDANKTTLDFGCGIGQFSPLFRPEKYYGVDTDKKYIDSCKKTHKGNFSIIKESPPYPFQKGFFDQVLISAVVHHIDAKKLKSISRELKRILKKDGKIVIVDHFTRDKQKNLFCKFLIILDRGDYFRNPDDLYEIFSKEFRTKDIKLIKNGPYKDYVIALKTG